MCIYMHGFVNSFLLVFVSLSIWQYVDLSGDGIYIHREYFPTVFININSQIYSQNYVYKLYLEKKGILYF